MSKVLVIGSEGFVGKPLCHYLESIGEQLVRFDIKRGAHEDGRIASFDFPSVSRVYFLAWDVGGAKYLYRDDVQLRQLDWNLRLMLNIMPQLEHAGVPFLFVSSQLAEEHDTVYGVTKRLGEVWTNLLHGVRVRLWNVYGLMEEHSERSHVVADFVHQALASGVINMLTTGEERRQFIHINDVCQALHQAISAQLSGLYDVTSFEWVTVRDVAEIIASQTGARIVAGSKAGNTPVTPMRGKIPGWMPTIRLEDGLSQMIRDARSRKTST